jgi:hypothetical protein
MNIAPATLDLIVRAVLATVAAGGAGMVGHRCNPACARVMEQLIQRSDELAVVAEHTAMNAARARELRG